MKRTSIILATTLILSASIYAMGQQDMKGRGEGMQKEKMEKIDRDRENDNYINKFSKLTTEQKGEIEKILKKYSPEKKKILIEIREKEIAVDKLIIEEKIEWTKVEKALTDAALSHVKMRLIQMKEQKEISEITGEEGFGFMDERGRGPMRDENRGRR